MKVKTGIIGCGNISDIYLKNLTSVFSNIEIRKCSDIILEKAEEKAKEYGIEACSVKELLADDEIKIIINLTNPQSHALISLKALHAGKHVYSEKPLAISIEDGEEIIKTAEEKDLLIGCAPDTFMGGGLQTSLKLIHDGWIGKAIGANVFLGYSGPESWHPDPAFLYHKGAGPLFDIGPYYITSLVAMFGSISNICSSTKITFPQRTITSEPLYGQIIDVEEPTHVTAILNFVSGFTAVLTVSFDVFDTKIPNIEIYGNKGALIVPDPNTYDGPVHLSKRKPGEWSEIPLAFGYTENSRGLAVSDMVDSLVSGKPHRANGKMAYHVLEVMHGILIASKEQKYYQVRSRCELPSPMIEA